MVDLMALLAQAKQTSVTAKQKEFPKTPLLPFTQPEQYYLLRVKKVIPGNFDAPLVIVETTKPVKYVPKDTVEIKETKEFRLPPSASFYLKTNEPTVLTEGKTLILMYVGSKATTQANPAKVWGHTVVSEGEFATLAAQMG